jgi:nicotinamide-nucleotide amidase
MQAEIICIGDELLIGQTINTNAAWLGEQLNMMGVRVHRSLSIADKRDEIISALDEAISRSQVIILTGGLGPTKDDITKHTLCEYFNTQLKVNDEALERITRFFSERGLPMLEVNRLQAALPEACTVIQNYRGTACGMWFEKDGAIVVSMPGVPYEMKSMMEEQVFAKIRSYFKTPEIIHRTILTIGVGESFIANTISDWENSLSDHDIKLAYLPSPGMVKLRMSVYGTVPGIREVLAEKENELRQLVGTYIYGEEKETLEDLVGTLLRSGGYSLSTGESCTGGNIAHLLTQVAGSSDYFMGGIVTYHEKMKISELGVAPEIIENKGVVSSFVAEAMAEGCKKKYSTTFSVATTGFAGPAGGTEENPVGTVWIAVSGPKARDQSDSGLEKIGYLTSIWPLKPR